MLSDAPDLTRFRKWSFLFWIGVGLYYFRFIKNGLILYPVAANCLLSGQPFIPCAPTFTYPPLFAFLMIPFAPLPIGLRNLLWYILSISILYCSFRLCESLILKTFEVKFSPNQLYWFRLLSLAVGLKLILAVLENQAYDYLVFFFILLGLYGLMEKKDFSAAFGIAMAAALKVTPLLFFPYLLLRRKWKVFAWCVLIYLFVSFLPDLFFSAGETQTSYFGKWVQDIVRPALSQQETASTPHFWAGENPLNQSLRSLVYRVVVAFNLTADFKKILYAVYALFLFSLSLVLLKASRLKNPYILDGSVLLIGMLMLSPMSSKSHFIVLILPYMTVLAYLLTQQNQSRVLGALLALSFILNSLTSKDLIGRTVANFFLLIGCITLGTLLLLILISFIVVEMAWRHDPNRIVTLPPSSAARADRVL
ncbi:MAG: DUF2029 domain-containing protein [Nitrospirae bacterium]|nr:DUF2029 domain-containing protein [Candidatus Manganitrophaceae bacterium]